MLIAVFVASVHLAGAFAGDAGATWPVPVGSPADHVELVGYRIAGLFLCTWGGAMVWWKTRGLYRRYPAPATEDTPEGKA